MLTTVIFVLAVGTKPFTDDIYNLRSAEVKAGGANLAALMGDLPPDLSDLLPELAALGGMDKMKHKHDDESALLKPKAGVKHPKEDLDEEDEEEPEEEPIKEKKKPKQDATPPADDEDEEEPEEEPGSEPGSEPVQDADEPKKKGGGGGVSGHISGDLTITIGGGGDDSGSGNGGSGGSGGHSGGGSSGSNTEDASTISELRFGIVRIQSKVEERNSMKPCAPPEGDAQFVGSGFIIDLGSDGKDPLAVTNAHVVSDAKEVCMSIPAQGQECYLARVALISHDWDLALLKLADGQPEKLNKELSKDGNSLTKLELLDYDAEGHVKQGVDVLALGFPLGKDSLAVTGGSVSGTEVVGEDVQIQQSAPISPGNSGGPLVKKEGIHVVVGVNFASAVQMGSQNNNFAIPAFRVSMLHKKYKSGKDDCDTSKDPAACETKIPPTGATAVKGTEALYSYYDCAEGEGALLTKIDTRSTFAKANPPVSDNSFITKVGSIALDTFGMGTNPKYIQDKVKFNDLIYMGQDLSTQVHIETCNCGAKQTHTISKSWVKDYEGPVLSDEQPNLEAATRPYLTFGNVTMQALTKTLAHHLILQQGELQLIPYVMGDNNQSVIIVTDVGQTALSMGGKKALSVGSVVEEINGHKVHTMEDVAKAFIPTSKASCSSGAGGALLDADALLEELQHKKTFTIKTKDGKMAAWDYMDELTRMSQGTGICGAMTDIVKKAFSAAGISAGGTLMQEYAKEQTIAPPKTLPIEDRVIFRGGMTVAKALRDAVGDGRLDLEHAAPSSFMQMGPGSMPSMAAWSLMQLGHAKPSSLAEMGPGGMTPESLMQLHRVHPAASSFMEMGPGGMEPGSLMQLKSRK